MSSYPLEFTPYYHIFNDMFDISQSAKDRILDWCPEGEKRYLTSSAQKEIFGVVLTSEPGQILAIRTDKNGVTIFDDNNLPTVAYSWHGLVQPIVTRILEHVTDTDHKAVFF